MCVTPVEAAWEQKLEADGLAPLDSPDGPRLSNRGKRRWGNWVMRDNEIDDAKAQASGYLTWAKATLATFHFRSHGERRIFGLLAEGRRYDDIQAELGVTSQDIARTVADVELMAPGAKPRNPWRKDGRKEATMGRGIARSSETAQATQGAQLGQLLEATRGVPSLGALQAAHLGQPVTPRPKFTYSRILMRRGLTFKIPGISVEKDTLRDIEGRPHVGGIDVVCTVEDFPGLKDGVPVVITLPWWKIDQADRALEV